MLVGNAGNDLLTGGTGNDTLYGNGGNNTFAFDVGMGNDTIMDFQISQDTMQFSTALLMNYSAAMADASQAGANTVININSSTSVTLENVTKTDLTTANFSFT